MVTVYCLPLGGSRLHAAGILYNAGVQTIAVINQKGGVGKTTTVANLGAALAAKGHDVCLIDLDPQAHLTLTVGVEPGTPAQSMYDVLTAEADLAATTIHVRPHLSVVPSVIDLAAAEVELVTTVGREQILRDRLNAKPLPHEYVLIDCPPSLGLLTLNALAAAQWVMIPLQPHFLALQGLGKLLETVSLVQRRINPSLRVFGVVLCMYETGTRLAGEVVTDLRGFFEGSRNTNAPWADAKIFETVIRRNVKLAECPSHGQTIFDYEPSSNGAQDYKALAKEFLAVFDPPAKKAKAVAAEPAAQPTAAEPAAPAAEAAPVAAVEPPQADIPVEAEQAAAKVELAQAKQDESDTGAHPVTESLEPAPAAPQPVAPAPSGADTPEQK